LTICISDGEGNQVSKYTGMALAGQTVTVPGDTVKLQLSSDDSGTAWGFKVTEVSTQVSPAAPGDVNGDGEVDKQDLTVIVLFVGGKDTDADAAALDLNGDGSVDHSDAAEFLRLIADELTVSDAALLTGNDCPEEGAVLLRTLVGLPGGL